MNTVLALIPARSGSNGLPHKNIRPLMDKPLMAYTIEAAIKSAIFNDVVVSTDSGEYADIAKSYGALVPELRDPLISRATTPTSKVTHHVLHTLHKRGYGPYSHVAVLPPTSPLRTADDIRQAFDLLINHKKEVVISVSQCESSPLLTNTLPKSHSLKNFIKHEYRNKSRQHLPTHYQIHGAIFIACTKSYTHDSDPYTMDSIAYVMPREHSIDIDSMPDFALAEVLLRMRHLAAKHSSNINT